LPARCGGGSGFRSSVSNHVCGRADRERPADTPTGVGDPHHFLAGGQGALPQNSQGRPWNGDYIFSSGDIVEDLTHNFFLETGARNNKLKVYEMVEHPAARALTGYLLVRGGVHQIAYARAIEHLTGANLMKMFPSPRIPTEKIPESRPHIERGEHTKLYRFSQEDFQEVVAVWNGEHPETRRRARRGGRPAPDRRAGTRSAAAAGGVRTCLRRDFRDRPEAPQAGWAAGEADRRRLRGVAGARRQPRGKGQLLVSQRNE
jgi:Mn-containing catalase